MGNFKARIDFETAKFIDKFRLAFVGARKCDIRNLRIIHKNKFTEIFNASELSKDWEMIEDEVKALELPELTGGVNVGDQRALYYLVKQLNCNSVLEIGTHIGCSTVHLALALRGKDTPRFITVDIKDVNDNKVRYYNKSKSKYSPLELIKKIECNNFVEFINEKSRRFLLNCDIKFDFIFLDGDHSAAAVYQELSLATKLLKKDGIILLHDYFSDYKPIWDNSAVICGPYLAVERFNREGQNIRVLPLGDLPWKTKINSHRTSLALVTRN